MIVRMWEVRADPEAFGDLLSWVVESAVPKYEHDPAHIETDVYSSADFRIVVISKWRTIPPPLGDPPRHLVSREPHFWDFSPVDR
ncbi:MAG: hypothetical protein ACRDT8_16100 [Micromonosporaceae bacterium]